MVARCRALAERGRREEVIPAAEIADITSYALTVTSYALAADASASVCYSYCNAISSMCEDCDENRVACGTDVIALVLGMMEAHPGSEDVQLGACKALAMLAGNAECAEHMRAGGRAAALLRQAKSVLAYVEEGNEVPEREWSRRWLMCLDAPEVGTF